METQPKKVYVSTPHLKRYLIINQLHFTPWPRPATYLATYLAIYPAIHRTPAIAVKHHDQRCVRNDSLGNIKQVLAVHPPMPEKMMLLCSCQC